MRYRDLETGEDMWSLIKATAIRDEDGAPMLAINVFEDVTEQREREQQLALPGRRGRACSAARSTAETTFPEIARLVPGTIADWCAIELLEDDGSVRVAAFAHADPDKQRLGEELRAQRYPPSGRAARARSRAGEPELRAELYRRGGRRRAAATRSTWPRCSSWGCARRSPCR